MFQLINVLKLKIFRKVLSEISTPEPMVQLQREAAKKGKDKMSMEEIEREIENYRKS